MAVCSRSLVNDGTANWDGLGTVHNHEVSSLSPHLRESLLKQPSSAEGAAGPVEEYLDVNSSVSITQLSSSVQCVNNPAIMGSTVTSSSPVNPKLKRKREKRVQENGHDSKDMSVEVKKIKKRKKNIALPNILSKTKTQKTVRVEQDGPESVWNQLGAFKCNKCGFTTTEQETYIFHACFRKRKPFTVQSESNACLSPVQRSVTTPTGSPISLPAVQQSATIPTDSPISLSAVQQSATIPTDSPISLSVVQQSATIPINSPLLPRLCLSHIQQNATTTNSAAQSARGSETEQIASHVNSEQAGINQTSEQVVLHTRPEQSSSLPETEKAALHLGSEQQSAYTAASEDLTDQVTRKGFITYDTEQELFHCKQCGFKGNDRFFIEHLMCQTFADPYHCHYCKKAFSNRLQFHNHCLLEHPKKKLRCKLRNVSLTKDIMNRAVEDSKLGKLTDFVVHRTFMTCMKKDLKVDCYQKAQGDTSSAIQTHVHIQNDTSTPVSTTAVLIDGSASISSEKSDMRSKSLWSIGNVACTSAMPVPKMATVKTSSVSSPVQRLVSGAAENPVACTVTVSPVTSGAGLALQSSDKNVSDQEPVYPTVFKPSSDKNDDTVLPIIVACHGNYTEHKEESEEPLSPSTCPTQEGQALAASSEQLVDPVLSAVAVESSQASSSTGITLMTTIPSQSTIKSMHVKSRQANFAPLTSTVNNNAIYLRMQGNIITATRPSFAASAPSSNGINSLTPAIHRQPPPPYSDSLSILPNSNLSSLVHSQSSSAAAQVVTLSNSTISPTVNQNAVLASCKPTSGNITTPSYMPVYVMPTQLIPPSLSSSNTMLMHLLRFPASNIQNKQSNFCYPQTVSLSSMQPFVNISPTAMHLQNTTDPNQSFINIGQVISEQIQKSVTQSVQQPLHVPSQLRTQAVGQTGFSTINSWPALGCTGLGTLVNIDKSGTVASGRWNPDCNLSSSSNQSHRSVLSPPNSQLIGESQEQVSRGGTNQNKSFPIYSTISPASTASPVSPPSRICTSSISPPTSKAVLTLSDMTVPVTTQNSKPQEYTSIVSPTNVKTHEYHANSGAACFVSMVPAADLTTATNSESISLSRVELSNSTMPAAPPLQINVSLAPGTTGTDLLQPEKEDSSQKHSPFISSVPSHKYLIRWKDSYACLACRERFHDRSKFYLHVWNHQHVDGQHCDRCSRNSDVGMTNDVLCTMTEEMVKTVSDAIADAGLLSHLSADCREKLSKRLLHSNGDYHLAHNLEADMGKKMTESGDPSSFKVSENSSVSAETVDVPSVLQLQETADIAFSSRACNNSDRAVQLVASSTDMVRNFGNNTVVHYSDQVCSASKPIQAAEPLNIAACSSNALKYPETFESLTDDESSSRDSTVAQNLKAVPLDIAACSSNALKYPETFESLTDDESSSRDSTVAQNLKAVPLDIAACSSNALKYPETFESLTDDESSSRDSMVAQNLKAVDVIDKSGTVEVGSIQTTEMNDGQDPRSANPCSSVCRDDLPDLRQSSGSYQDISPFNLSQVKTLKYDRCAVFFICSLCKFSCDEPVDFLLHLSSDHPKESIFPCYHCHYAGLYTSDLTNHIKDHTVGDSKMYWCPFAKAKCCEFGTDSLKSLTHHMERHKIEQENTYWCRKCGCEFHNQAQFLTHLKRDSMTVFSCSKCPARFLEKQAFQQHWQAKHSGGLVVRVVKILLCQDRKANNYQPPALSDDLLTQRIIDDVSDDSSEACLHAPSEERSADALDQRVASENSVTDFKITGAASDIVYCVDSPLSEENGLSCQTSFKTILPETLQVTTAIPSKDSGKEISSVLVPPTNGICSDASVQLIVEQQNIISEESSDSIASASESEAKETSSLCLNKDKVGVFRSLISRIKLKPKTVGSLDEQQKAKKECVLFLDDSEAATDQCSNSVEEEHVPVTGNGQFQSHAVENVVLQHTDQKMESIAARILLGEDVNHKVDPLLPASEEAFVALTSLFGSGELHELLFGNLYQYLNGKFSCCICDKRFEEVENIHKDLFKHFEVPLLSCTLCHFGCSLKRDFMKHLEMAHPGAKKVGNNLLVHKNNLLEQLRQEFPVTLEKFKDICQTLSRQGVDNSPSSTAVSEATVEKLHHSAVREGAKALKEDNSSHKNHTSSTKASISALHNVSTNIIMPVLPPPSKSGTKGLKVLTLEQAKSRIRKGSSISLLAKPTGKMVSLRRTKAGDKMVSLIRPKTGDKMVSLVRSKTGDKVVGVIHSKTGDKVMSLLRPKTGTYRVVKEGAMRKLKCNSCGNTTLSLLTMRRHLETCARYLNSEHVSEHTNLAESLVKKMNSNNLQNVSESTDLLDHSYVEKTSDIRLLYDKSIINDRESRTSPSHVKSAKNTMLEEKTVTESGDNLKEETLVMKKKKRRNKKIRKSKPIIYSDSDNSSSEQDGNNEQISSAADLSVEEVNEEMFGCKICCFSASGKDKVALEGHLRDEHPNLLMLFKCGHCDIVYGPYGNLDRLAKHTQTLHPGKKEKKEVPPLTCFYDIKGKRAMDKEASLDVTKQECKNSTELNSRQKPHVDREMMKVQHIANKQSVPITGVFIDISQSTNIHNRSKQISNSISSENKTCESGVQQNNQEKHSGAAVGMLKKSLTESSHNACSNILRTDIQPASKNQLSASDSSAKLAGNQPMESDSRGHQAQDRQRSGGGEKSDPVVDKHRREPGFLCVLCNQLHMNQRLISAHISQHLDYRTVQCSFCPELFLSTEEAKQHHFKSHSGSPFTLKVIRDPQMELKLNKLVQESKNNVAKKATNPTCTQKKAAETSEENSSGEFVQALEYKESIQCHLCQALQDCIKSFKKHWDKEHGSSKEKMAWVDVRTQNIYNVQGGLLQHGCNGVGVIHKYLCAFCSFRASVRELVVMHSKETHSNLVWLVSLGITKSVHCFEQSAAKDSTVSSAQPSDDASSNNKTVSAACNSEAVPVVSSSETAPVVSSSETAPVVSSSETAPVACGSETGPGVSSSEIVPVACGSADTSSVSADRAGARKRLCSTSESEKITRSDSVHSEQKTEDDVYVDIMGSDSDSTDLESETIPVACRGVDTSSVSADRAGVRKRLRSISDSEEITRSDSVHSEHVIDVMNNDSDTNDLESEAAPVACGSADASSVSAHRAGVRKRLRSISDSEKITRSDSVTSEDIIDVMNNDSDTNDLESETIPVACGSADASSVSAHRAGARKRLRSTSDSEEITRSDSVTSEHVCNTEDVMNNDSDTNDLESHLSTHNDWKLRSRTVVVLKDILNYKHLRDFGNILRLNGITKFQFAGKDQISKLTHKQILESAKS